MTIDVFAEYGLRRIINLAGIETVHGAARVPSEVAQAICDILPHYVEMSDLQSVASAEIAATIGAEAGYVTNCVASAIALTVAATMTGLDPCKVEQLPDTAGMKNRVLLQKGHEVHYGATISQMIRLAGGKPVEIGTATSAALFQLKGALAQEAAAAAVYVVSHHTVQHGMIALRDFSDACRAAGVPVIVDAAAEYDWATLLDQGADLIVFSAHKALLGPTAGIVAGKRVLVQACYHQEYGIGRAMKAGKESIVGAIAALRRWRAQGGGDARIDGAAIEARLRKAEAKLGSSPGLSLRRQRDPTGNPFTRLELHVDPAVAGRDAFMLAAELGALSPKIALRSLHADLGYLLLDMRTVSDGELDTALDAILSTLATPAVVDPVAAGARRGDRAIALYRSWPKTIDDRS
jgi:uncharacterized pyridoxal phosphate-dependent enzyme